MRDPEGDDLEAAYDITFIHPDYQSYLERWADEAAAFRHGAAGAELAVAYGPGDRERLDVFMPDGEAAAMVVFFHGGYWVSGERGWYSHLAAGALGHGLAFAVAGHDLAPDVDVATIVTQAKAAVALCHERYRLPVMVAGHSAGGHLAAVAVADPGVAARRGLAVSGLFDLRPFVRLRLNRLLGLDERAAAELSPVGSPPPRSSHLTAAVGAEETPAFHRQARSLQAAWPGVAQYRNIPGRHHLSVIEDLAFADSDVTTMLVSVAMGDHEGSG